MPALPIIAVAIAAIGTGIAAYSSIKQGSEAKKASVVGADAQREIGRLTGTVDESQAQLADYNAAMSDLQAQDAIARGEEDAARVRQQIEQVIGQQRAGFAGSNIDVGFGSTVDVQADAAYLGELDVITVKNNAAREAWGYSVQATDLRKRAEIARLEAHNAIAAGELNATAVLRGGQAAATTGLLTGLGTIASSAGSYLMNRYGYTSAGRMGGSVAGI